MIKSQYKGPYSKDSWFWSCDVCDFLRGWRGWAFFRHDVLIGDWWVVTEHFERVVWSFLSYNIWYIWYIRISYIYIEYIHIWFIYVWFIHIVARYNMNSVEDPSWKLLKFASLGEIVIQYHTYTYIYLYSYNRKSIYFKYNVLDYFAVSAYLQCMTSISPTKWSKNMWWHKNLLFDPPFRMARLAALRLYQQQKVRRSQSEEQKAGVFGTRRDVIKVMLSR